MIELILTVIGAVLVLSFFGISIPELIDSPTGQENVSWLTDLIETGFNWIVALVSAVWNAILSVL